MKILLSAFFCRPGIGSEEEVGWQALLAASEQHDVWLVTRPSEIERIASELPPDRSVNFVGVDGSDRSGLKTHRSIHVDYDRWQRRAADEAMHLDSRVGFDLVHHATMAAAWTRTGVAVLDRPLVWGPVGGRVTPPRALLNELGSRGLAETAGRSVVRPVIGRLLAGRVPQQATVAIAQNQQTAAYLLRRGARRVILLPNGLCGAANAMPTPSGERTSDVVVVSRLIPWKAVVLAVEVFAEADVPNSVLRIFGSGPERSRVLARAHELGIADRVDIQFIPREELQAVIARAGVLLHTALHEEASLTVGEALSLGTPIVALDRGGPADLVRFWDVPRASLVPVRSRRQVITDMAAHLRDVLAHPPPVPLAPHSPRPGFGEAILAAYDEAAMSHL